jgi:hypothetical protein
MSLLLYSTQPSTRLSYIIDFFSKQINAEIVITNNIEQFRSGNSIKINYSASSVTQQELWIQPHTLLFENNIQLQITKCFQWNNLKVFFTTGGDIPFDIFAAAFYLLSRYEEYLPYEEDMYGRYAHTNSLAYKEGFLQLPLINLWIEKFKKIIQQKFPHFHISTFSHFQFLPTYDIDIAYEYKHHSLLRNLFIICKNLGKGQFRKFLESISVITSLTNDTFDTYEWLDQLHEQYNLQSYYFFLLAEKRKGYDKNLYPHSAAMHYLIEQHAAKYEVGIHPSWQSGDDGTVLKKEISLLQNITGKPVTKSRQHYIRMTLPETYRLLIENDITEDHSMGYGSINGFRASVASSFYWYDLEKEQQTSLLIRPFCYMEANSFFEQGYTATEAAEELQQYHDVVKSVGGDLITIFHNHFVTEQKKWLPWRNMYADFLKKNFG